jgi:hypothetical protein
VMVKAKAAKASNLIISFLPCYELLAEVGKSLPPSRRAMAWSEQPRGRDAAIGTFTRAQYQIVHQVKIAIAVSGLGSSHPQ